MTSISEHINMIMSYIPYLQANFVQGLDDDEGMEPFELTRMFLDGCPGSFPACSLLFVFGEAAPLTLELQQAGRVLPFPFHYLNNHHAMNVKPKNYKWPEFYDHLIDLVNYSFTCERICRRFRANKMAIPKWMNVVRAVSSERWGHLKNHWHIRHLLDTDRSVRDFFECETEVIPSFYINRMKQDLGEFWAYLPEGTIRHDPNAYLKKIEQQNPNATPHA